MEDRLAAAEAEVTAKHVDDIATRLSLQHIIA